MIITRPVRFTAAMSTHRRLLEALGGRCLADYGDWVVYALGQGRLALHTADHDYPAGLTTFGFETDDLETFAADLPEAPEGVSIGLEDAPHGRAVVVCAVDGTRFTVDPATADDGGGAARSARAVSVIPMWLTDRPESAVATLQTLGARRRIVAEDGLWTDLSTDSGLLSVHSGAAVETTLNFEYGGTVEDLIDPLAEAGFTATLIDEAYSRTLRLSDPDRPGEQIWISEEQQDLYGYRREG